MRMMVVGGMALTKRWNGDFAIVFKTLIGTYGVSNQVKNLATISMVTHQSEMENR
jgi:hypothetical protein